MAAGETHVPASARPAWMQKLQRYSRERRRGSAGFTVLAGPVSHAIAVWQHWNTARGGSSVMCTSSNCGEVVRRYADGVLAARDISTDIAVFLAPHAGIATAELAARLSRQGSRERAALRHRLEGTVTVTQLAICDLLLDGATGAGLPLDPATVSLLATLVGTDPLPGLLLVEHTDHTPAPSTPSWVTEAAASALALARSTPGLMIGLAIDPGRLDQYLRAQPESHLKAHIRTGRIDLSPNRSPNGSRTPPAPVGAASSSDRSRNNSGCWESSVGTERIEYLAGNGDASSTNGGGDTDNSQGSRDSEGIAIGPNSRTDLPVAWLPQRIRRIRHLLEREAMPAQVLAAFDHAAGLVADDIPGPAAADRARSAAERLLYQRLNAHPETAGQFVLNGLAPFRFGPGPAEVDLLANDLAIAVEVDGYYHFQNPDAYRRDRRKDVLLQIHGFLVVRCLARDVVTNLDAVMTLILQAVHFRQRRIKEHT